VVHTIPSGTANDDFPHRKKEMAVALAGAQTCVPKLEPPSGEIPDHQLALVLDAIRGDLVVCAEALTRRDVSVFFDMVTYACWNLDPKTGFLTRRRDLGRSYFECRDGTCTNDTAQISFDGKSRVEVGETTLTIVDRESGAVRLTIHPDFDVKKAAFMRGDLTYLSNMLFVHVDDHVLVYDDHGAKVATLPGGMAQVVSDHAVVSVSDDTEATAYDLKTHETRKLTVAECTPPASEERTPRCIAAVEATYFDAVEFRGNLYAVHASTRQLVVVDPKTHRQRSAKQLAICK
jgi:hypothetical protein